MPPGPSSRAIDSARLQQANLAALNPTAPARQRTAVAPVKTTAPPSPSSMSSTAVYEQCSAASGPTDSARRNASGSCSSRPSHDAALAWLTSTSTRAERIVDLLEGVLMVIRFERSVGTASASPGVSVRIRSASVSRYDSERASSATEQPSPADRSVSDAPRLGPTPAMTAVLDRFPPSVRGVKKGYPVTGPYSSLSAASARSAGVSTLSKLDSDPWASRSDRSTTTCPRENSGSMMRTSPSASAARQASAIGAGR